MLLIRVMGITALYGFPAVTIFLLFSEKLTVTFFHSLSAATYLELLWPSFYLLFSYTAPSLFNRARIN